MRQEYFLCISWATTRIECLKMEGFPKGKNAALNSEPIRWDEWDALWTVDELVNICLFLNTIKGKRNWKNSKLELNRKKFEICKFVAYFVFHAFFFVLFCFKHFLLCLFYLYCIFIYFLYIVWFVAHLFFSKEGTQGSCALCILVIHHAYKPGVINLSTLGFLNL